VKVNYRACSLSLAKDNGWMLCSELFRNNNDVLELGTIFPFAVNMMMVQQFVGNNKARASALDTPNIYVDIDIGIIQHTVKKLNQFN
jgi:hypothetical protein